MNPKVGRATAPRTMLGTVSRLFCAGSFSKSKSNNFFMVRQLLQGQDVPQASSTRDLSQGSNCQPNLTKSVDLLELKLEARPSVPGVQAEQTVEFKINRTYNRLKCSVKISCLLITLDRLSLLLSLSHSESFKFFHFGVLRVN